MDNKKIHKNAFGAYSGSLLQLSHGETVENHGFLVWNLKDRTVKEVNVENPYSMHNIYIHTDTNYDDLSSIQIAATEYNKIVVHWRDYAVNMTKENLDKIRRYLVSTFKPTEIRFERKAVDKGTEKVAIDDLRLDNIGDVIVQRDIVTDYLKSLHHGPESIAAVLDIDRTITERLTGKGIGQGGRNDCHLLNLTIDNFKSFGEGVEVSFEGNDGIWQIVAENQFGKSSTIDGLMYLYYGKTLDIKGREKHSDNRYINFKQNLDYCQVTGDHEINNQLYRLVRRTEREWKRTKGVDAIKGLSTTFSIYRLDSNHNIIEDESVDKRRETEKLIAQSIGNYEDFQRASFISADTLNNLISTDHSQFLDALLRDIGLDIFEKKLDEFKVWKKEVFAKIPKYVVDVLVEEGRIAEWTQIIDDGEAELVVNKQSQKDTIAKIKKGRGYKEEQLKKLFPIDPLLSFTNKDKIQAEINAFLDQKELKEREIHTFQERLDELPAEYDEVKCTLLRTQENEIQTSIREKKGRILEVQNEQEKVHNKKNYVSGEMELLRRKINALPAQEEKEKSFLSRSVQLIEKEIQNLEDSQYCPTCERIKDESTVKAIEESLFRKRQEVDKAYYEVDAISKRFLNEKYDLINQIQAKEQSTLPFDEEIAAYNLDITIIKEEMATLSVELTSVGMGVKACEIAQQQLLKRQKLESEMAIIPIQLEKIDLQIDAAKLKFSNFQQAERLFSENEKIQNQIDKAEARLNELEGEQQQMVMRQASIEQKMIPAAQVSIKETESKLVNYREQEKREGLHKLYEDCFHRDGIPATILTKSLKFINTQMEELLVNVNFRIYIDEEFTFRMMPIEFPGVVMSALSGSGMERTFAALVLRIALRMLNNKSRNNILILDEVLGKLSLKNFQKFLIILQTIKPDFEKIFIIEHAYSDLIEEDYRLNVVLDENQIASLQLD